MVIRLLIWLLLGTSLFAQTWTAEQWRLARKGDISSINILWYGAIPDDEIDDSDALSEAIEAADASNSKVILPAGTFYFDNIVIDLPTIIEGVKNGTIIRGTNTRTLNKEFLIQDDLSISNVKFLTGYIPLRIDTHEDGVNISIVNCDFDSIKHSVLNYEWDSAGLLSRDYYITLNIENNQVTNSGNGFIAHGKVKYANAQSNYIHDCTDNTDAEWYGFRFGNQDDYSDSTYNVIVANNVIDNIVLSYDTPTELHGILVEGKSFLINNNIINNLSSTQTMSEGSEGIYVKGWRGEISNNNLFNAGGSESCIAVKGEYNTTNITVIGNVVVKDNGTRFGHGIYATEEINVLNNVVIMDSKLVTGESHYTNAVGIRIGGVANQEYLIQDNYIDVGGSGVIAEGKPIIKNNYIKADYYAIETNSGIADDYDLTIEGNTIISDSLSTAYFTGNTTANLLSKNNKYYFHALGTSYLNTSNYLSWYNTNWNRIEYKGDKFFVENSDNAIRIGYFLDVPFIKFEDCEFYYRGNANLIWRSSYNSVRKEDFIINNCDLYIDTSLTAQPSQYFYFADSILNVSIENSNFYNPNNATTSSIFYFAEGLPRISFKNNYFDENYSEALVLAVTGNYYNLVDIQNNRWFGTYPYKFIVKNAGSTDFNITAGSKIIKNNYGYTTSNSGTASISSGTTVDVTHSLAVTPSINNILVTPQTNLSGASYWISNVGSTTFRINVSASGSYDFSWIVRD